uniref:Uncharacterized protein n=1 Tax=Picea glauca TaxID=3330 RepID=A0A124GMQ7_PICGL|nr:hypothetical protein ABT39_MTgene1512 [Picea glauca]
MGVASLLGLGSNGRAVLVFSEDPRIFRSFIVSTMARSGTSFSTAGSYSHYKSNNMNCFHSFNRPCSLSELTLYGSDLSSPSPNGLLIQKASTPL